MIYFYLAWMERFAFAFANVWRVECADCPFELNHFFSPVHPSVPVFVSAPEAFVPEKFFSYYGLFCGIGVVPAFGQ